MGDHRTRNARLTQQFSLSLVTETSNCIFIKTKLLMRINSIRSDPKQAKDRNGYFPLCQMEESQLVKISITLQM